MGQHAERLREPPLREGIGGIPLVIDRERALEPLIHQVRVEHCNLLGELHAEDELNLGGIGRVLALTPNDGVNTLITQRFLEMFGRRELYQLAGKRGPAAHSRSRVLFGEGVSMAHLYKRHRQGANVTATTIEGADDYRKKLFLRDAYTDDCWTA